RVSGEALSRWAVVAVRLREGSPVSRSRPPAARPYRRAALLGRGGAACLASFRPTAGSLPTRLPGPSHGGARASLRSPGQPSTGDTAARAVRASSQLPRYLAGVLADTSRFCPTAARVEPNP